MILLLTLLSCSYLSDAQRVAYEQTAPEAALRKYEWFKDAAAQLDKKRADISVYKSRMTGMEATYIGQPRQSWLRSDAESYNTWSSEVAGTIASYNALAAEYNANMSKINWKFADTLPREFTPYLEKQ